MKHQPDKHDMNDELSVGTPVRTTKPAKESDNWDEAAKASRRWGLDGTVIYAHSGRYQVQHKDGTDSVYERRELRRMDVQQYTSTERKEMIAKMRSLSNAFYDNAVHIGVHAFIEFCGLMNEFIQVCNAAEESDIDFTFANTHSGTVLPMQPNHAAYLAEKLGCIYGPALVSSEEMRRVFIDVLFDGEFKLVPVHQPEVERPVTTQPLDARS